MAPDPRFYDTNAPLTLEEALDRASASLIGGALDDFAGLQLTHISSFESASQGAVVFADNEKTASAATKENFGLCLVTAKMTPPLKMTAAPGAVATAKHPRQSFAVLAARLHRIKKLSQRAGVDRAAEIDDGAVIHETAVIGAGAQVSGGVCIEAGAVIGPGVCIGEDTHIGAGASIYCAVIGPRCYIKAGARIGEAGFGFIETSQGLMKAPQLGRVIIDADVEIGANSTVDRGALDDTIIGEASKIDNLVQIAHNVILGRNCILASQSGVAGSSRLGDGVILGGKAGIADHLTIGDGVQIAGKAGVMHDIPSGERWGGYPAMPARQWMREVAAVRKRAGKKRD